MFVYTGGSCIYLHEGGSMEGLATTAQVAAYLGVRPNTLDRWSSDGTGPKFTRVNGRRRYHWEDVRTYAGQSKPSGPDWKCSACGQSANIGARLIVSIDHAILQGDADWGVLHDDCHFPVPNPYEIDISRADTWPKLLDWVAHLWEKEWVHSTDIAGLLRKAGVGE